jgi:hypothetical protein
VHVPAGLLRAIAERTATTAPHAPRNIEIVADNTLTMKLPVDFLRMTLQVYGIWITAAAVRVLADGGVVTFTYAMPFELAKLRNARLLGVFAGWSDGPIKLLKEVVLVNSWRYS